MKKFMLIIVSIIIVLTCSCSSFVISNDNIIEASRPYSNFGSQDVPISIAGYLNDGDYYLYVFSVTQDHVYYRHVYYAVEFKVVNGKNAKVVKEYAIITHGPNAMFDEIAVTKWHDKYIFVINDESVYKLRVSSDSRQPIEVKVSNYPFIVYELESPDENISYQFIQEDGKVLDYRTFISY